MKIIALVVEVARRYWDAAWKWSEERKNIARKIFFKNWKGYDVWGQIRQVTAIMSDAFVSVFFIR